MMSRSHRALASFRRSTIRLSLIACLLATLCAAPNGAQAVTFPTIASATVVAHYDSDFTTLSGSQVTTWPNQATYGTLATQAALNASPAGFQTGGGPTQLSSLAEINGKPYLRFTNVGDVGLQTTAMDAGDVISSATPVYIIHVGRLNVFPLDANMWYDGRTGSTRKLFLHDLAAPNNPALFSGTLATTPDNDAAPLDGQFHMWTARFDGTNSNLFIDGPVGEGLTPNNPGAVTWDGMTIGSRFAPEGAHLRGIDGDMAELVVIAGNLSASDWDAIGTYFEAKFGIDTAFSDPVAVPEPSTFALLGLGVFGLTIKARRRRTVA